MLSYVMMNDPEQIVPYLAKIIETGIQTEEDIDPIVYACVCHLNLNSMPEDLNLQLSAEMALTTVCVFNHGELLSKIHWLIDGCVFDIYSDKQHPLVFMVAAVLNTINEMRESDA